MFKCSSGTQGKGVECLNPLYEENFLRQVGKKKDRAKARISGRQKRSQEVREVGRTVRGIWRIARDSNRQDELK